MDVQELRRLKPELDLFLERCQHCSGRTKLKSMPTASSRGCSSAATRRNVENIAEAIARGASCLRSMQEFIGQARPARDGAIREVVAARELRPSVTPTPP